MEFFSYNIFILGSYMFSYDCSSYKSFVYLAKEILEMEDTSAKPNW